MVTSKYNTLKNGINKLPLGSILLLKKLITAKLLKKFLTFHETRIFITVFTTACHRTPS
jgi:hypothetical protein